MHRRDDDEEVEHVRAFRAEEVFCRPRHCRGGLRRVLDGARTTRSALSVSRGLGALGEADIVHENRGLVHHARGEGGSDGGVSRLVRGLVSDQKISDDPAKKCVPAHLRDHF